MYTKRVKNKEQLERIIGGWGSVGYNVANRGIDWVVLRKQNFGSGGTHIILFLLTLMVLWIPNIIYALYSYYLKKEEWMFIVEGSPIPNDIEVFGQKTKPVNNNKSGMINGLLIVLLVAIVVVGSAVMTIFILFSSVSSDNFVSNIPDYASSSYDSNYSSVSDDYSSGSSNSYDAYDESSADYSLSLHDSNGDARISWSEWVAWCEYETATYGYYYDNFNRYDSNNNGYLDRDELITYYSNL